MSDLARQAMEKIAEIVGDRFEDADVEVLRAGINSVGSIVSHEQAALLREVKRALAGVDKLTIELLRTGEFRVEVVSEHELRRAIEIGEDATAALKSALDAAGVPDEKGT